MRSIKLDKLDRSSILFICRAELSAFGSLYGEKDKYGLGDDLNMFALLADILDIQIEPKPWPLTSLASKLQYLLQNLPY